LENANNQDSQWPRAGYEGPQLGFGALSLSLALSFFPSLFRLVLPVIKFLLKKTHFIILNRKFYTNFQVTASLFFLFFPWLFIA
jgi:hypothetical protein